MNKFITYTLLLLTYLALSKSLSPNEFGIKYVNSDNDLAGLIPGSPVSVILIDIHSTGFLIKTYYHKYKIVYGFQSYEEIITRTSSNYTKKMKPYLGMSIFRRYKKLNKESFLPLPPGSIFIGDYSFGNWVKLNSNTKIWKFFRVYRQIPNYLGWKDFRPTFKVFSEINKSLDLNKPFYGSNDEFGINGLITQKSFPKYFERQTPQQGSLKDFFKTYFKENFIQQGLKNE
ncbi:MAG: hypothetical protein HON90_11795 [Halobacteriovoraceae bacterium]|jgi:hypothetical protein|nr:hypothetical protein [Halobacteriovoraceae bacterium]